MGSITNYMSLTGAIQNMLMVGIAFGVVNMIMSFFHKGK